MQITRAVPMKADGLRPRVGQVLPTVLLGLAGLAFVVAGVYLLLPNQVEVGPSNTMFFDCGSAVSPTAKPHQEPGISACEKVNDQMRFDALVPLVTGSALGALGLLLLLHQRRRAARAGMSLRADQEYYQGKSAAART